MNKPSENQILEIKTQQEMLVKILKQLKKQFPDIWGKSLDEINK